MENSLKELLVLLRAMQLYYHNCHNVVFGAAFLSDHDLFSGFYGQAETEYDAVAERLVGLYGRQHISLKEIVERMEDKLEKMADPSTISVENMFAQGGMLEADLKDLCNSLNKYADISAGTQNLIAQIADNAEARFYKIRQRLTNE
jgi:DNA-binding ferritin-like protein